MRYRLRRWMSCTVRTGCVPDTVRRDESETERVRLTKPYHRRTIPYFAGAADRPTRVTTVGALRGDAIAMTTELRMLALSIVLGFVHIILASHAKSSVYGYRWSAGPRDQGMPPLPGAPAAWSARCETSARRFRCLLPQCSSPMPPTGMVRSPSGAPSSTSGRASPISRSMPSAFRSCGRWSGTWLRPASFLFCWAFFEGPTIASPPDLH